ncbi:formate dehydrogenase accessory protein FdhE [Acetobacter sp.]|jgi:FdhE protein|uniref:formate dehydrogenase accessory protein FdhE n=1 Tax=Acetobacter sp. TaxID=440 RepID=UPI0025C53EA5|nr:formate dehydrogenase accessory protein FdhE [Acetobacter sp.]MCH4092340.1 formate dehydrogenase accessory protein FdhE [Acetobacter sp.]MCI1300984.1 formate dehydrogenase accessory protein FdhE [Acetobacter sp.]MCI1317244.1 formate dehydrogenase accessory protein FdhE [Acetobacter sp.]
MHRDSDVVPLDKRTPGVPAIEELIFPQPDRLYARRIRRLNALAGEQGEYFRFLSRLVGIQQSLVGRMLLSEADATAIHALIQHGYAQPDLEQKLEEIAVWRTVFAELVQELLPVLPLSAQAAMEASQQSVLALSRQAAQLLRGDYATVDAGLSVVLWAALSVCWAQTVAFFSQSAKGGQVAACPCCGAPPSGSVVLGGDREGLRYLQCSLCETRWHRVRGLCVSCGASSKLEHFTLDDLKSATQAEACGDCGTYLKVIRLDYDPDLEVVADDLGGFTLDALVQAEGFSRAGLNPFSFPV